MVRAIVGVVAGVAIIGSAHAAFPASYPYENELLEVGVPLAATPSHTFDDTDPGGYFYTYGMNTEGIPDGELGTWSYGVSGMIAHRLVVHQGLTPGPSPLLPKTLFNCTFRVIDKEWKVMSVESFLGVVGSETICEGCCEAMYGLPSFWDYEPKENTHEKLLFFQENGMCEYNIDENLYCTYADLGFHQYCNEQFVSETERSHIAVCYDALYQYFMNCKVFASGGTAGEANYEPTSYFEESSPSEMMAWDGVQRTNDKVCHPMSYYYPQMAKQASESESSESGGASEASKASSASTVDSSIAIGSISLALFTLMFSL